MTIDQLFRLCFSLLLIGGITTSGYFRLQARKAGGGISRTSEPTWLMALRLLLVLPVLGLSLSFLFNIPEDGFYTIGLSSFWRWSGLFLAAVMVPLMIWVLRTIGKNISETVLTRDGQELITSGPYRWIRHPLYTAGSFFLLGLSLLADSLPLLLISCVGFSVFYGIINVEERELVRRFGENYQNYSRSTGRLFPRLLTGGNNAK